MSYIRYTLTACHTDMCVCERFLAPVRTWQDVAERHQNYDFMSREFKRISDDNDDWAIDLYGCKDCGRYWVREDCGGYRGYTFFYYVGMDNPELLLDHAESYPVLERLHLNRDDEGYQRLIKPYLE